ncbi:MAG: response regulator [Gemmataceae bacterium]
MDDCNKMPGLRILLVEDSAESAANMALLLTRYGHQVEIAGDGRTALRLAQANQPDVALLDIGLPDIDGCEVARQIKSWTTEKQPLLVALTGFSEETDRRRSKEAGIDLHLVKPVDPAKLENLLSRFQQVMVR